MENAHQTYIVHRYSPILPCYVVYVISLLLFCCNITIICLNFVFFSFTCPVVLFPFLLTSNLWMPFSSPIFRIHTHTHTKGRGIFFFVSVRLINYSVFNFDNVPSNLKPRHIQLFLNFFPPLKKKLWSYYITSPSSSIVSGFLFLFGLLCIKRKTFRKIELFFFSPNFERFVSVLRDFAFEFVFKKKFDFLIKKNDFFHRKFDLRDKKKHFFAFQLCAVCYLRRCFLLF